jgi:hypothetical protein
MCASFLPEKTVKLSGINTSSKIFGAGTHPFVWSRSDTASCAVCDNNAVLRKLPTNYFDRVNQTLEAAV